MKQRLLRGHCERICECGYSLVDDKLFTKCHGCGANSQACGACVEYDGSIGECTVHMLEPCDGSDFVEADHYQSPHDDGED